MVFRLIFSDWLLTVLEYRSKGFVPISDVTSNLFLNRFRTDLDWLAKYSCCFWDWFLSSTKRHWFQDSAGSRTLRILDSAGFFMVSKLPPTLFELFVLRRDNCETHLRNPFLNVSDPTAATGHWTFFFAYYLSEHTFRASEAWTLEALWCTRGTQVTPFPFVSSS